MSPVLLPVALSAASSFGSGALLVVGVVRDRRPALWGAASLVLLFSAVLFASRAFDLAMGCAATEIEEVLG